MTFLEHILVLCANLFPFYTRCLTRDDTRPQKETVEPATRIVTETETEGEDIDTEERRLTPPAVTEKETETGGDVDTDRKEAMYGHGGALWSN